MQALRNFNPKRNGRKCSKKINTNPVLENAATSVNGNLGEWYLDMSFSNVLI